MAVRDSPSGSAGNAVPSAPCTRHRFGRPCRFPAAALPSSPRSPPVGAGLGRAPSIGLAGGSCLPRVPQPRDALRPTGRRGLPGLLPRGAPGGPLLRFRRWAFIRLAGPGPARGCGPYPLHAAPRQQVPAGGDGDCQAAAGCPGLLTLCGVGSCVPGAVSPRTDPCELACPRPARWDWACVPAAPWAEAPALKPVCAPLRARPALSGYTG